MYVDKYAHTRVMVFSSTVVALSSGAISSKEIMADSGEWKLSDKDENGNGKLDDKVPVQTDDRGLPVERWFNWRTLTKTPVTQIEFTPAEQSVRQIIDQAGGILIPKGHFITDDGKYVVGYARAANSSIESGLQTEGFQGTGFTVMTEQPTEEAFVPLEGLQTVQNDLNSTSRTMLIAIGVVILAVVIAALMMASYFSRRITKPLTELRDAADKVSIGDLAVTLPSGSDDEIGDLADSFERLVAAVRFMLQEEERRGSEPVR
jgi:HAMP domain-containing protein